MTILDIYKAASQRGLVRSKRQFSSQYLGGAPNYLADVGFGGCSARALVHLFRRLGEEGQADLQAMAFQQMLNAENRGGGSPAVRP
jgi:hypothetical protein